MQPDNQLLQQYIKTGSEEAFAELVTRHVNLVYSAALRQVGGDAHLARDVAQNVFTDLARKADSLSHRESLTGWLYTSAHFAAGKIIRTETRRREREEKFMREPSHNTAPDPEWEKLRPTLDTVMHELGDTDREAVLLRYFENRAYAEVGSKLGMSENTARMRVERALEKLRALLAKRGITTGATLASVISANAVQTAPSALVQTLASTSIAGAGTFSLFKILQTTSFKLGLGSLVVAGGILAFTANRHAHEAQNQPKPPQQAAELDPAAGNSLSATGSSESTASNRSVSPLKAGDESGPLMAGIARDSFTNPPATDPSPVTNKIVIKLKIKFVSLPEEDLQALRPAWPSPSSGCGTLTADQFKFVNKAIHGTGDFSETESQITAFNGQAASMVFAPVVINGTNTSIQKWLGITPSFSPESMVFQINFIVQWLGLDGNLLAVEEQAIKKTNAFTLSAGQTAVLQKPIPLPEGAGILPQELLVFVTPELGDTNRTAEASDNSPDHSNRALEAARLRINNSREAVLALIMFASDNQNQIPPTLAQAGRYLKDGKEEELEANFEVTYSGSISAITKPAETIILTEKQPQEFAGKWTKTYGFADGHSEVHTEATGNFEAFEKDHSFSQSN